MTAGVISLVVVGFKDSLLASETSIGRTATQATLVAGGPWEITIVGTARARCVFGHFGHHWSNDVDYRKGKGWKDVLPVWRK